MPKSVMSKISELSLPLERDFFLRNLLNHLAGVLEETVGKEEASGYISIVGAHVGAELDGLYKKGLGLDKLSREEVADVLVNLKERIKGDFFVIEQDENKIVFGNRRCPFEDKVIGRPSLCMMTSNVFGSIAAENLGYAKVSLEETIAEGHKGCRVVLYLKDTKESENNPGREYYGK